MTRRSARALRCAAAIAALGPASASAEDAPALLAGMSAWLAAQPVLALRFDSSIEAITPELEKLQFASSGEALLVRPDRLRARRVGGHADVGLVFDGRTLSVIDHRGGAWTQIAAPGTVDDLVMALRAGHGVALPAADLLLSDPYAALMADAVTARHVGSAVIGGRLCEHLAFRNAEDDWQIWIEAGERPAPCRLTVTSKTMAAAPQYTITFTHVATDAAPPADAFAFAPDPGAERLAPDALLHLDELPDPAAGDAE
jgi:hypothetical protein